MDIRTASSSAYRHWRSCKNKDEYDYSNPDFQEAYVLFEYDKKCRQIQSLTEAPLYLWLTDYEDYDDESVFEYLSVGCGCCCSDFGVLKSLMNYYNASTMHMTLVDHVHWDRERFFEDVAYLCCSYFTQYTTSIENFIQRGQCRPYSYDLICCLFTAAQYFSRRTWMNLQQSLKVNGMIIVVDNLRGQLIETLETLGFQGKIYNRMLVHCYVREEDEEYNCYSNQAFYDSDDFDFYGSKVIEDDEDFDFYGYKTISDEEDFDQAFSDDEECGTDHSLIVHVGTKRSSELHNLSRPNPPTTTDKGSQCGLKPQMKQNVNMRETSKESNQNSTKESQPETRKAQNEFCNNVLEKQSKDKSQSIIRKEQFKGVKNRNSLLEGVKKLNEANNKSKAGNPTQVESGKTVQEILAEGYSKWENERRMGNKRHSPILSADANTSIRGMLKNSERQVSRRSNFQPEIKTSRCYQSISTPYTNDEEKTGSKTKTEKQSSSGRNREGMKSLLKNLASFLCCCFGYEETNATKHERCEQQAGIHV